MLNSTHPRRSVATDAAQIIEDMVSEKKPGERIGTKKELQAAVGVSYGPLNEALRLLQVRGLVTLRTGPSGGVFVAEQSPVAKLGHIVLQLSSGGIPVADANCIRLALEQVVLEDAIANASSADILKMRKELAVMKNSLRKNDHVNFVQSNWALHRVIAASISNKLLSSIYSGLMDIATSQVSDVTTDDPGFEIEEFHEQRYEVHVEMVDAIESRDASQATDIVKRHNDEITPG